MLYRSKFKFSYLFISNKGKTSYKKLDHNIFKFPGTEYIVPVEGVYYIFPLWLNKIAIQKSINLGIPGRVMLHPHELDPDPPKFKVNLE